MDTQKPWRDDPSLRERFHSDYPDDVQVMVHDGGPRFSEAAPELMWVRVLSREGAAYKGHAYKGHAYKGQLLNAPHGLRSVQQNSTILFVTSLGAEHPLRVSEQYLSERDAWKIVPCDKCGLPELFDAPSDLIARIFPDIPPGAGLEAFTSFCPLCGGIQVVEAATGASQSSSQRPWWQLWKAR